jgi:hypothetical protein
MRSQAGLLNKRLAMLGLLTLVVILGIVLSHRKTHDSINHPRATFIATAKNEADWRPDVVPKQWPQFTVAPGQKPPPHKSPDQIIALAKEFIANWDKWQPLLFFPEKTPREALTASGRVIDYLLTIDPSDRRYPEAWALFIRARQIDREIGKRNRL